MTLSLKDFRGVATGIGLSATVLTGGCGITSEPILPKRINISQTNPNTCIINRQRSFQKGFLLPLLLPILNLIPDTSDFNRATRDGDCDDRRFSEILLNKNDRNSQAIAVAIYDQLTPVEKGRMDSFLQSRGTSMDELAADLPRIVNISTTDNCAIIRYRLPGTVDDRSVIVNRCVNDAPANQNAIGGSNPAPS